MQNNVDILPTATDNVLLIIATIYSTELTLKITYATDDPDRLSLKPCLVKVNCTFCAVPQACQVSQF